MGYGAVSTMSIRHKLIGLLGLVLILWLAASSLVQALLVLPSFNELEIESAQTDLRRCADALERDAQAIGRLCSDYASWDDAVEYLSNGNDKFREDNLSPSTYEALDLDLIAYLHNDGSPRWLQARDRHAEDQDQAVLPLPEFPAMGLPAGHRLLQHKGPGIAMTGMVHTSHGILLLAAAPITNTDRSLPIYGTVLMGRFLDADRQEAFEKLTAVPMSVVAIDDPTISEEQRTTVAQLTASKLSGWVKEPGTLHGHMLLNDLFGQPLALLSATWPRSISQKGRTAALTAFAGSVVGSLLILVTLWALLNHAVVHPLSKLTRAVVEIALGDDLNTRLQAGRRDELGELAGRFNALLDSLAESRNKLVETAHQAGMSEVATEVLHNVGNAVNSIGVGTEVLEERLRKPPAGFRETVAALQQQGPKLNEFLTTDNRAQKLVDYLTAAASSQERSQNELLQQLHGLRASVADVKAIIATQQHYARRVATAQNENITQVVEDALRISNRASITGLKIERQFQEIPPLPLERTKILQILANLIGNALDAMKAAPGKEHTLSLAIRQGQEQTVQVSVGDTGVGIAPHVADQMFAYGFTTKKQGHGYGLHYCMNTARALGGRITFSSPGSGAGAVFTLELPLAQPAEVSGTEGAA